MSAASYWFVFHAGCLCATCSEQEPPLTCPEHGGPAEMRFVRTLAAPDWVPAVGRWHRRACHGCPHPVEVTA